MSSVSLNRHRIRAQTITRENARPGRRSFDWASDLKFAGIVCLLTPFGGYIWMGCRWHVVAIIGKEAVGSEGMLTSFGGYTGGQVRTVSSAGWRPASLMATPGRRRSATLVLLPAQRRACAGQRVRSTRWHSRTGRLRRRVVEDCGSARSGGGVWACAAGWFVEPLVDPDTQPRTALALDATPPAHERRGRPHTHGRLSESRAERRLVHVITDAFLRTRERFDQALQQLLDAALLDEPRAELFAVGLRPVRLEMARTLFCLGRRTGPRNADSIVRAPLRKQKGIAEE